MSTPEGEMEHHRYQHSRPESSSDKENFQTANMPTEQANHKTVFVSSTNAKTKKSANDFQGEQTTPTKSPRAHLLDLSDDESDGTQELTNATHGISLGDSFGRLSMFSKTNNKAPLSIYGGLAAKPTILFGSKENQAPSKPSHDAHTTAQIALLKKQLQDANSKIAAMDQELTQSRITRQTIESAIGRSSNESVYASPNSSPHGSFMTQHSTVDPTQRTDSSNSNLNGRSHLAGAHNDMSSMQKAWNDSLTNCSSNNAWFPSAPASSTFATLTRANSLASMGTQSQAAGWPSAANAGSFSTTSFGSNASNLPVPHTQWNPTFSNSRLAGSALTAGAGSGYAAQVTPTGNPFGYPNMLAPSNAYTEPLPDHLESKGVMYASDLETPSVFIPLVEPINYRRLLERSATTDWKIIVEKIVTHNDQQASIFLQQKLKVAMNAHKYEIINAIIERAYSLMVNRFGNFLVQRCFEHGTHDQVIAIARVICGNTLKLSMDAFGCHVIQKAFDAVPEEYKTIMVQELLCRIPETVIHRYACHVWQKLFELHWAGPPPQIMKHVNDALRGMWHEVALGETGSLVVQNIFENCVDADKRPCVEEVLTHMDTVAHGQFGNWCIQHICELGAPSDRMRAITHVLRFAAQYSVDQFASKVIEKCLKTGGNYFLDRYLERLCEANPTRPRIPLIDVASDQFGNFLIQYILMTAPPVQRELVASQVRKHMVSLRGSRYGSRVAMACCDPAVTTRPGPSTGMLVSRNPTFSHGNTNAMAGVNRSMFGPGFR